MGEKTKRYEIDMENIIRIVYNKIAIWNNNDGNAEQKAKDLKITSQEIVQAVLELALDQLSEVKTKTVIKTENNNKKKKKKWFGK